LCQSLYRDTYNKSIVLDRGMLLHSKREETSHGGSSCRDATAAHELQTRMAGMCQSLIAVNINSLVLDRGRFLPGKKERQRKK